MFRSELREHLLHELDRLFDLVGLNEDEVTLTHLSERQFDRQHLAACLVNVLGEEPLAPFETLSHESNHFAIGSAARALIFVDHHLIEAVRDQFALLNDVLVTSVARRRVHDDAAFVRHPVEGFAESDQRRRVVSVVDHDRRTTELHDVESSGDFLWIVDECFEGVTNHLEGDTERPTGGGGGHDYGCSGFSLLRPVFFFQFTSTSSTHADAFRSNVLQTSWSCHLNGNNWSAY